MDFLSVGTKKSGRCREVARGGERQPLADVILYQGNQLHYPLDGNLSGGQHYPPFEKLGPNQFIFPVVYCGLIIYFFEKTALHKTNGKRFRLLNTQAHISSLTVVLRYCSKQNLNFFLCIYFMQRLFLLIFFVGMSKTQASRTFRLTAIKILTFRRFLSYTHDVLSYSLFPCDQRFLCCIDFSQLRDRQATGTTS